MGYENQEVEYLFSGEWWGYSDTLDQIESSGTHTDLSAGKSGMSLLQGSVSAAQCFWECKNISRWQHPAEL